DADMHNLAVQVGFAAIQQKYSGTVSYRDGTVRLQQNRTLPHELDARFSLTKLQFSLENATLTSGRSQINLEATAQNFSQPNVQAKYSATLNATELRTELKNSNIPQGTILLSGQMSYHDNPARPAIQNASMRGEVHSAALTIAQQGRAL